MANYCENKATFQHDDPQKVAQLLKEFQKGDEECLPFSLLYPIPDGIENRRAWAEKHWGTTEPFGINIVYDEDNEIHVEYLTRWTPPLGLYEKAQEDGWTVNAYYVEFGCQLCGFF